MSYLLLDREVLTFYQQRTSILLVYDFISRFVELDK